MTFDKKYAEKAKLVAPEKKYLVDEALTLLKQTARAKFDESVDLSIKLGVDTVKTQSIRGTVDLPGGSGKSKKVAVITRPDRVAEAERAGADIAGSADLVEKIKGGFLGFDILIASPDMMGELGKLGKVLGPKGLMPNPKSGTVSDDVAKAVKDFKGGKVEFKMDKGGVVHMLLGKISFPEEKLKSNLMVAVSAISRTKPSGFKGIFIKSITLSATMGPGIKLNSRQIIDEVAQ